MRRRGEEQCSATTRAPRTSKQCHRSGGAAAGTNRAGLSTQVPTAAAASSGSRGTFWGCCRSCGISASPWGRRGVRDPSRCAVGAVTGASELTAAPHLLRGAEPSPGRADWVSTDSTGRRWRSVSHLPPRHPRPVLVSNPNRLKIGS